MCHEIVNILLSAVKCLYYIKSRGRMCMVVLNFNVIYTYLGYTYYIEEDANAAYETNKWLSLVNKITNERERSGGI